MKKLTHYLERLTVLSAGCILLSLWPPHQAPAQQTESAILGQSKDSQSKAVILSLSKDSQQKDSVEKITREIKQEIKSKFDSIQCEIKRIRQNHKPKYITRTHTRKVNHYVYDTVLVFIDTCFVKELPTPAPDTVYTVPEKKQTRLKIFFNKIFNHKKTREDYLKIVSP